MRNLIKASLSCLVLLFLISSPVSGRIKLLAREVLTGEKVAEPKLNATDISMVTDDEFTLKVYNLTENQSLQFKSDDSSIVSVSKSGKLSALKVGETTITVTLKGAPQNASPLKCKVYVGPPAISVRLTLSELTIEVGKKKSLQVILKPNTTAESAVFTSIDPDVVAVSATGKLIAKAPGKTYVMSAINNGRYDLCLVTVVEAESEATPAAVIVPTPTE